MNNYSTYHFISWLQLCFNLLHLRLCIQLCWPTISSLDSNVFLSVHYTFILIHFAFHRWRCCVFHPCEIWSRVFQSCVFHSRVFSRYTDWPLYFCHVNAAISRRQKWRDKPLTDSIQFVAGNGSMQQALSIRELTCHTRSHSVTCHPAGVTFPPLPQPKLVLDLATPERCKAELT